MKHVYTRKEIKEAWFSSVCKPIDTDLALPQFAKLIAALPEPPIEPITMEEWKKVSRYPSVSWRESVNAVLAERTTPPKTPGQKLYEKFSVNTKRSGLTWDNLGDESQQFWHDTAKAAAEVLKEQPSANY